MSAAGDSAAGHSRAGPPGCALQVEVAGESQLTMRRLALELEWFDALNASSNILSLWQPQRALAVTALEAAMPHFATAAQAAERRGLSVEVRKSGGGCVCLGPGTLVVGHLYRSKGEDIERTYRDFAAKLIAAVARLHISLRIGQIAGAYCDGRFDLSWNGLKVGGIAQRRRARAGYCNVWVHAVLSVDERSLSLPQEVAAFYHDLHADRQVQSASTTALACCMAEGMMDGAKTDLMTRCMGALVQVFTVSASRRDP